MTLSLLQALSTSIHRSSAKSTHPSPHLLLLTWNLTIYISCLLSGSNCFASATTVAAYDPFVASEHHLKMVWAYPVNYTFSQRSLSPSPTHWQWLYIQSDLAIVCNFLHQSKGPAKLGVGGFSIPLPLTEPFMQSRHPCSTQTLPIFIDWILPTMPLQWWTWFYCG